MGGYAPPPVDDAPKTAAEADAQNKVGRANRENVGLSGYGGRSSAELDYINYQTQQQETQTRVEQQRARERSDQVGMKYAGWERDQVQEQQGKCLLLTEPLLYQRGNQFQLHQSHG